MTHTKVAFLGLGAIGYPMARRIAEAGFELAAWNRTISKAQDLARATGARAAATPADAAKGASVVITCLPTSAEVEDVAFGADGAVARGSIMVDCTSGDPHATRSIAARLAEQGM